MSQHFWQVSVQISEAKMKPRLKKYLKVVEKIIDNVDEIFSSDIESSGSEKRNEEHRNEKEEREIEAGEGVAKMMIKMKMSFF